MIFFRGNVKSVTVIFFPDKKWWLSFQGLCWDQSQPSSRQFSRRSRTYCCRGVSSFSYNLFKIHWRFLKRNTYFERLVVIYESSCTTFIWFAKRIWKWNNFNVKYSFVELLKILISKLSLSLQMLCDFSINTYLKAFIDDSGQNFLSV